MFVLYRRSGAYWYTTKANYDAFIINARREHRFPAEMQSAKECLEYLEKYLNILPDEVIVID